MSTVPHRFEQDPRQRIGQVRAGNQNARRHGLYSQLDPRPPAELASIAARAAIEKDLVTLKGVARAFDQLARVADNPIDERRYRQAARGLRSTIRVQERAAIADAADAIMVAHLSQPRR